MSIQSFQDQFFSESMHQMFNKHFFYVKPEDPVTSVRRLFGRKQILS